MTSVKRLKQARDIPSNDQPGPGQGSVSQIPTQKSYQKDYAFIDGNAPSRDSKKRAMSHVMREQSRQKRLRQSANSHARLRPLMPVATASHSQNRDDRVLTGQMPGPQSSSDARVFAKLGEGEPEHQRASNLIGDGPQPRTSLSSLRRDQFSCLPVSLDPDDHELIDYWLVASHAIMRRGPWQLSQDNTFAPIRDVFFSLAMLNPSAFQNMVLLFASEHRARVHGIGSQKSITHRARAIEKLRNRMQASKDRHDDGDLAAVLAIACTETCISNKEETLIHLRAATSMVLARGGASALKHNQRLEMFFHWVLILGPPCPLSLQNGWTVEKAYEHSFESLICFLDRVHSLAQADLASPSTSVRNRAFKPNTILHQILHFTIADVGPLRFKGHCRLAALLFIHATLLDNYHCEEATGRFLETLHLRIVQAHLDKNPTRTCHFMWLLLQDPVMRDSDRFWYICTLLQGVKALVLERQRVVADFLLTCLVLDKDINGKLVIPEIDVCTDLG